MKHLKLFETYKSQKELELLTNYLILKLVEETYKWHEDFVWKEPNKNDYGSMEDKTYRVIFKNKHEGFIDDANYVVDKCNGYIIKFKGYNHSFTMDEVELKWSEVNQYKFIKFIKTNVESACRDKLNEFDELVDMIKNTHIGYRINLSEHSKITNTKGYISHREKSNLMNITINMNVNILRELGKYKKEYILKTGKYKDINMSMDIISIIYSTTLHELQHAFDIYRSNGKAIDKLSKEPAFRNDISSINDDALRSKMYNKYLNFPHEINARFTQAINKIIFTELKNDVKGNNYIVMIPLGDIINKFKKLFHGYMNLSDEYKRKLIRKVSQFWHFEKDRISSINDKEKVINESNSELIGYHVTDKKNLENILDKGLIPKVPEDFGLNGDVKGVYLFRSKEDDTNVLFNWLGIRIEEYEEETGNTYEEILLEVDLTNIKLDMENSAPFEYIATEIIKPDRIISIDYSP